jgi:hypothetical protein
LVSAARPQSQVISTLPNPAQESKGQLQGFVAAGGYIYLAGWDGITILDVHTSTQILIAGQVATRNSDSSRIAVSGSTICFTGNQGHIYVMDISEPIHPKLLGHINAWGYATDLAISGDWVYKMDGHGMTICNIADLKPPNAIDTVYTTNSVEKVALLDDYAYAAGSSAGGTIYRIDLGKNEISAGIELDPIVRIFVSREWVYGLTQTGIYVIDNTQPDRLVLGQYIDLDDIAASSSVHWSRIVIENDTLYVVDGTMLKVLSIKDEVYVVGGNDEDGLSLLYTLTFPDTSGGYIDSVYGDQDRVYFSARRSVKR